MKNGWDELSGALFAELKRLGDTSLSTDVINKKGRGDFYELHTIAVQL